MCVGHPNLKYTIVVSWFLYAACTVDHISMPSFSFSNLTLNFYHRKCNPVRVPKESCLRGLRWDIIYLSLLKKSMQITDLRLKLGTGFKVRAAHHPPKTLWRSAPPPPPLLNPPRVSEREKLVIVRFLGYPSERKENNTNDLKEIKLSIKASWEPLNGNKNALLV